MTCIIIAAIQFRCSDNSPKPRLIPCGGSREKTTAMLQDSCLETTGAASTINSHSPSRSVTSSRSPVSQPNPDRHNYSILPVPPDPNPLFVPSITPQYHRAVHRSLAPTQHARQISGLGLSSHGRFAGIDSLPALNAL